MEDLNKILKEKIKCRIIEELMRGDKSFSEILKKTGVKDHGQLNYHLKILLDKKLIEKKTKYSLTSLGNRLGVYVNQIQLSEIYPLSVVFSIIKDKTGKILLIKRGKNPYKDFWAFPGGKVRIGESIKEASERELLEETGLNNKFSKVLGFFPTRNYKNSELDFHANLIPVEMSDFKEEDEINLDGDCVEYLFVNPKNLRRYALIPTNKKILQLLKNNINFKEIDLHN